MKLWEVTHRSTALPEDAVIAEHQAGASRWTALAEVTPWAMAALLRDDRVVSIRPASRGRFENDDGGAVLVTGPSSWELIEEGR